MITEKDRPQVEILIKGQHAENAAGPDANE
jgi:hypothetical protein